MGQVVQLDTCTQCGTVVVKGQEFCCGDCRDEYVGELEALIAEMEEDLRDGKTGKH